MKSINDNDPLPTLGERVERPVVDTTPWPRVIRPGIVQGPDGKLETQLPLPVSKPARFTVEWQDML